ncbi:MAG: exonuclease domain-containing protein [Oleiphilaceae bacterium]|nr:exonuclease domain-containing protein [Oleiphilaceae bacterium]
MSIAHPTFIDFEASSLDLVASYPIEVGVCLGDGSVHSWLIKPHVLWQDWSEKAARIHGIPRDELEREGSEVWDVAEQLNALLSGHVYCDAWTFDSFWLHRLFKAAKIKPDFHLDSISSLLTEEQVTRWQDCHRQVIHDLKLARHRAANDARILHETWLRLTGV